MSAPSLSIFVDFVKKLRNGHPEKIGRDYGTMKSEPNKPFSTLIIPLLKELEKFISYQDKESANVDLNALKAYVDQLNLEVES